MNFSLGLDIATSASIFVATFFYIQDLRRARIENIENINRSKYENEQKFAISRMQKIIDAIGLHRVEFNRIQKSFNSSIGKEKTAHFNSYLDLLYKLKIDLTIVKDSDFIMYANEEEVKSIDEIMNYINEVTEYVTLASAKMIDGSITADEIKQLMIFINTYDQKLSKLTITYAKLLKHRLSH